MSNIQRKLKENLNQVKEDVLGHSKQTDSTQQQQQQQYGENTSRSENAPKTGFDSGGVHDYSSSGVPYNAGDHHHDHNRDSSNYTHSSNKAQDTSPTFAPRFGSATEGGEEPSTIDSNTNPFGNSASSQSANPDDFRTTSDHGQKYSSLLEETDGADVADSRQGVKNLNLGEDNDQYESGGNNYQSSKGRSSLDPALKDNDYSGRHGNTSSSTGTGVALGAATGAGAVVGAGAGYIATLSSYIPGFGSSETEPSGTEKNASGYNDQDTSNLDRSHVGNIRVRSDDPNTYGIENQGSNPDDYGSKFSSQRKSQDTSGYNDQTQSGSTNLQSGGYGDGSNTQSSSNRSGGLDYDKVQGYASQGGQKGESLLGQHGQGEAGKYVGLAGAGAGAGAGYLGARGTKGSNTNDTTGGSDPNIRDSSTKQSGYGQTGLGATQGDQSQYQSGDYAHRRTKSNEAAMAQSDIGNKDYIVNSQTAHGGGHSGGVSQGQEELHIPGTFVTDDDQYHSKKHDIAQRANTTGQLPGYNDSKQGGDGSKYASGSQSESHTGRYAAGGGAAAAVGAAATAAHMKSKKASGHDDLDNPDAIFTGDQDANYSTAQNAERDYRAQGGDRRTSKSKSDKDNDDNSTEGHSKSGGLLSTLGLKKKEKPSNDNSTNLEKGAQKRNYGDDKQGKGSNVAGYSDNSKVNTKPAREELQSTEVDQQGFRDVHDIQQGQSRGDTGGSGGLSSKHAGTVTSHGARFDPPTSGTHGGSASASQSQSQGYNTSGSTRHGASDRGYTGATGAGVGAATGAALGSAAHSGHTHGHEQEHKANLSHQKGDNTYDQGYSSREGQNLSSSAYDSTSGRGAHQSSGKDSTAQKAASDRGSSFVVVGGAPNQQHHHHSDKVSSGTTGGLFEQQSDNNRSSGATGDQFQNTGTRSSGTTGNVYDQSQNIGTRSSGTTGQQQQYGGHDKVSEAYAQDQFSREGGNNLSSAAADYPQSAGRGGQQGHQHKGATGAATGGLTAAAGVAYAQQYGSRDKTSGSYAQDQSTQGDFSSAGNQSQSTGRGGQQLSGRDTSSGQQPSSNKGTVGGLDPYGQQQQQHQQQQYSTGGSNDAAGYRQNLSENDEAHQQFAGFASSEQQGQGNYSGQQRTTSGQTTGAAGGTNQGIDYTQYQKYADDGGKQGKQFLEKHGQGEAGKYVGVAGTAASSGAGYLGSRSGKQGVSGSGSGSGSGSAVGAGTGAGVGGNSNLSAEDNNTARQAADNALHSGSRTDTAGDHSNTNAESSKKDSPIKGMLKKVFN